MMAFTAMLSELYDAFRRKVGADEAPAKATVEDARLRSIDGKIDTLSHTMDQRLDALSERFDVVSQPSEGLSHVMDQRFGAFELRHKPGLLILRKRTSNLTHHHAGRVVGVGEVIAICRQHSHVAFDQ
jgi:hypothetical protein